MNLMQWSYSQWLLYNGQRQLSGTPKPRNKYSMLLYPFPLLLQQHQQQLSHRPLLWRISLSLLCSLLRQKRILQCCLYSSWKHLHNLHGMLLYQHTTSSGGLYCLPAGCQVWQVELPVAENTTLLSVTCSRAVGVVVPIPTFCAFTLKNKNVAIVSKIVFFIPLAFNGIKMVIIKSISPTRLGGLLSGYYLSSNFCIRSSNSLICFCSNSLSLRSWRMAACCSCIPFIAMTPNPA